MLLRDDGLSLRHTKEVRREIYKAGCIYQIPRSYLPTVGWLFFGMTTSLHHLRQFFGKEDDEEYAIKGIKEYIHKMSGLQAGGTRYGDWDETSHKWTEF